MYFSSKFKCHLSFNWHLNLIKICATQSWLHSEITIVNMTDTSEGELHNLKIIFNILWTIVVFLYFFFWSLYSLSFFD